MVQAQNLVGYEQRNEGVLRTAQQDFLERLSRIPVHGLGLSVDVYSPDISSLLGSLRRRQVLPEYLEVFRAAPAVLEAVRQQAGSLPLSYHGEGLWLTQPDAAESPSFTREILAIAGDLRTLESAWSNHECATKEMAGYTFGTYLPPLYTPGGAQVIAANARYVQAQLDRQAGLPNGGSPLLLLELPPLTYFAAGTVSIPEFFRSVTDQAACGLVLDIGHLWTVFRYAGFWKTRTLEQFLEEFLLAFPLERVVEIHVAGLAAHESIAATGSVPAHSPGEQDLPCWTDAHMAPIPPVLYDLLDRVLRNPRLTSLRGLALEVDTKPVELIVEEFESFLRRYRNAVAEGKAVSSEDRFSSHHETTAAPSVAAAIRDEVQEGYDRYARIVSGQMDPAGDEWTGPCASYDELDRYRAVYLPHEILRWGGDLEAMFPEVCGRLAGRAVDLRQFVPFWFRRPRSSSGSYDFFLMKIERFLEFIHEIARDLDDVAASEAEELRRAYAVANEPVAPAGEKVP
jgi:uncharacterized protein (UPF0276 family)